MGVNAAAIGFPERFPTGSNDNIGWCNVFAPSNFLVGAKGDPQKGKRHRGAVWPHPSPAAHYRSNPSPGKIPLGIETTPYLVRFCLAQAQHGCTSARLQGYTPDPHAACGRNFLASVPKGQPKNGLSAALPKVYAPRGRFDNCVKPSSRPMTRCLFC